MTMKGLGTGSAMPPMVNRCVAVQLFFSFAFAYFLAAMLRGVTATLAPYFSDELGLNAGDLGMLGGAYFLGFAAMQLPLGSALDRFGPRRVLLSCLALALLGCVAFSLAQTLFGLTLARGVIGVGVSACLMAPMTSFRRRFSAVAQMRANSWMLMAGSMGMVASTLPVQWLLPHLGWRGLFGLTALLIAAAMMLIASNVAPDPPRSMTGDASLTGFGAVFRHRTFLRYAPMGFVHYGGLIAIQSLWAGPWLVQVCGWTPSESSQGLFAINVSMLVSFLAWGSVVPRLYRRGWTAHSLIARGMPVSVGVLVLAVAFGANSGAWVWAVFCVAGTVLALSQPAIGQAFPAESAGRALTAYNLVVFGGVFSIQWGIGLAIDLFQSWGWATRVSFQGAFAILAVGCGLAYAWFVGFDDSIRLSRVRAAT
jgi:predicted MFS family arabinose efflux permease